MRWNDQTLITALQTISTSPAFKVVAGKRKRSKNELRPAPRCLSALATPTASRCAPATSTSAVPGRPSAEPQRLFERPFGSLFPSFSSKSFTFESISRLDLVCGALPQAQNGSLLAISAARRPRRPAPSPPRPRPSLWVGTTSARPKKGLRKSRGGRTTAACR